jgi:hypothetical protein
MRVKRAPFHCHILFMEPVLCVLLPAAVRLIRSLCLVLCVSDQMAAATPHVAHTILNSPFKWVRTRATAVFDAMSGSAAADCLPRDLLLLSVGYLIRVPRTRARTATAASNRTTAAPDAKAADAPAASSPVPKGPPPPVWNSDERQAIVLEIGACVTRIGLAGDDAPRDVFPTVTAPAPDVEADKKMPAPPKSVPQGMDEAPRCASLCCYADHHTRCSLRAVQIAWVVC